MPFLLLPIADDNPTIRKPVVTWTILGLNVALWVLAVFTGNHERLILSWGLIPAKFQFADLITSQFVHAGITHIGGNMLFFWIFGDNVEDRLGRAWFLFLYLASGAAGAIGHALAVSGTPGAAGPLVGASGAISGVMAAYLILYPHQPIRIFWLVLFIYGGVFRARAIWVIGAYAGLQVVMVALSGSGSGVAYWAHIGGFVCGAAIAIADRWRRGLPHEIMPAAAAGPAPVPFALPVDEAPVRPPRASEASRGGYAVIRADDAVGDVGDVGRLVAKVTGEPGASSTRRIRRTRGVLAHGLTIERARAVREALKAGGGPPVLIVDEALAPPLPEPVAAASAAAGPDGFVFDLPDGSQWTVPWTRVAAVFAARLDRHLPGDAAPAAPVAQYFHRFVETTFVDVLTRDPVGRIRLAQQRERSGASPVERASPEMERFCANILRSRGAIPVNHGVAVAAGRGSWGYLRFPSEPEYEDYAWWLVQLIRSRAGAARVFPE